MAHDRAEDRWRRASFHALTVKKGAGSVNAGKRQGPAEKLTASGEL
jgi:hypothetical protein